MVYYGSQAKRYAEACSREIARMFNEPRAVVHVAGVPRRVEFDVSHLISDERNAIQSIALNQDPRRNFVRVEEAAKNRVDGRSNHGLGRNCGFYSASDDLGNSTTCTHEFAHGLGLVHYGDRPGGSKRVQGQPGIMAPRGSLVDAPYQYAGGKTLNPYMRKVLASDIADLGLDALEYDSKGCASLGSTQDFGHDAWGKPWKDPWLAVSTPVRILVLINEQLSRASNCNAQE